jgi:hypothetical protein
MQQGIIPAGWASNEHSTPSLHPHPTRHKVPIHTLQMLFLSVPYDFPSFFFIDLIV